MENANFLQKKNVIFRKVNLGGAAGQRTFVGLVGQVGQSRKTGHDARSVVFRELDRIYRPCRTYRQTAQYMLRHEISGFPLSAYPAYIAYPAYLSYPAYGSRHRKGFLEKSSADGYITSLCCKYQIT